MSGRTPHDVSPHTPDDDASAYLAAIVQSSDDAIISKDLNGIIQSCNGSAERLFGYTASELIGRPVRLLIPADRQSEEDDILAKIRRGDRIEHFETIRRRKDGRLIDISLTVSPVRNATGAIIGVSKIARDITERKRAAAELVAQQAWFSITLGSIGEAVIAAGPDARVSFMNATAERLTGWTSTEATGHPIGDVVPLIDGQTREPLENLATLVLRTGQAVVARPHTLLPARNGIERPVSATASPILAGGDRMVGVVVVFRDTSEERRAEEAVAEQREWFKTTLESIGDAVIATDVEGRVVFMNPVAGHLTGWRLEEALGERCERIFRIVQEGTGAPLDSPVHRALTGDRIVGVTRHTLLRALDGSERPIDDSSAPIRGRDGRIVGAVLVFRDVSERRRVELERQASASERERLLSAERLARSEAEKASRVKDDFVAMVSHELRTPLNAILGWTQLMSQEDADPKVMERGLDVVARNTRLQAQLIADLLDISRIVAGKLQLEMQQVDLKAILGDAIDTVQGEADQKGIEIGRRLGPERALMVGDPARLQQVIWNVLSNAIKFTPRGGRVDVTMDRAGDTISLIVTDTGAGIALEVLPHVFDRFQQADRSITRRFGGLGLGLSIVRHLVDLHGGTVRADSPGPGRGATFTLTFPFASSVPAGMAPTTRSTREEIGHSVSLESARILVVEDEADTREFLARLLGNYGAHVTTTASASEALAVFLSSHPDIIVSDIGLPDVDGYDLIRTIRGQEAPGEAPVPAVALTAYARSEDRARALRAGFQDHLAKPIEAAELITALARLRGGAAGLPETSD